jgi:hypothetical protein
LLTALGEPPRPPKRSCKVRPDISPSYFPVSWRPWRLGGSLPSPTSRSSANHS